MAGAGALVTVMIGCTDGPRNGATGGASVTVDDPATSISVAEPAGEERGRVLFVGTSLTAGLGVPEPQSYPLVLEQMIDSAGLSYDVVNAGISGETSAGARARVDWLLQQPFDVLVLETGANDMLRGVPPASLEANLREILDRVRAERPDAEIVLVGMRAAPNLGPGYVSEFEAIYPRLASEFDLTLVPFLLEGVAAMPDLNQGDGIHPTAEGHRILAANVWRELEGVLRE